jgi:hypothetical protein
VTDITDDAHPFRDPGSRPLRKEGMTTQDFDVAFETFETAQAGAVAHLETMSEAAREAAQDVLMASEPMTADLKNHAARLSQVAEQCDALAVLIGMLDLPPAEDGV